MAHHHKSKATFDKDGFLIHPILTDKEHQQMFNKLWRKIWDHYVQPKVSFKRDIYILSCYSRQGNKQWSIQRTMWAGVQWMDLAVAFGEMWPGFSSVPTAYGSKFACLITRDSGAYYTLHRVASKEPSPGKG